MAYVPDPYAVGQAAQKAKQANGWGWNPLSDFQKATSGVGNWFDEHTKIGSFNPGIGHLVASGANMLPGLTNAGYHVGKDVVTGDFSKAGSDVADIGKGMWHGATDTATDLVTLGGLAPWTKSVEEGEGSVYGYTPKSIKEYATQPGQGLGGAAFNDAANIAIVADGAGALAKLGEVGEAASAARAAEIASKTEAIDAGAKAADVSQAGEAARTKSVEDAAERMKGDTATKQAQIESRLKVMDRIDAVRNGASLLLEPWKAARPLARAAGALHGAETPASLETPSEAPTAPAEAAPVSGATSQVAATPGPVSAGAQGLFGELHGNVATQMVHQMPIEKLTPGNELRHEITPGAPDEPLVVQRHGNELRVVEGNHRLEAAKQAGETHVPVRFEEAPNQLGGLEKMAAEAGKPTTNVPHEGTPEVPPANHLLQEGPGGEPKLAPEIAKKLENVPRAYKSYVEESNPVPKWATTIVGKLPGPARQMLAWMDAQHQKIDYQTMVRQQMRSLAVDARRIENTPEIKAMKEAASELVKARMPGVSPTVASNIVGQLARVYLTHPLDMIERLEASRPAMEEAAPGVGSSLVDAQLGYSYHIPDEVNTPEFRAQIFQLAEQYRPLRENADQAMADLGEKGLSPTSLKQKLVAAQAGAITNALAEQSVTELQRTVLEQLLPGDAAEAFLNGSPEAMFKLRQRLEEPAMSNIPPKWQPMMTTARKMAADIKKYPALAPVLADFPKTFADALDYATEMGFDPRYMPDLTPRTVRDLVAGTARLGAQGTDRMGKQFESAARKTRRGTLQQLGAYDNSIDALVAGLNQASQEARTNMVVDWIDRVAAKDLPVNAAGRRLGAPTGWVEWDPIRRGMLAIDKPGGERLALGGKTMIPRTVAQAIKEYAGDAPTNPIYRTMKTMTDPWRALMLTLNPGFYLKHFQGHIMLAGLAGGINPKIWLKAYKEARNGFENVPEVTGQNITMAEMGTPGMVGYPSIREGGIGAAMEQGGPVEAGKYIAGKMHNVIAVSDSFARAVAYFSKTEKGWTPERAAQYAQDAVVDYGNLSNTERYWVRSLIPFYSFEKGVAKIFFKMPIDHPLASSLLMSMAKWQAEQAKDDQGNPLPERYQGVVDLPLLGKVDMQKFNPFRDVESLTTPEGLVSSLQYAVQDVVRAGLGVPAPGTKATVKIDKYGRLVPDVSLGSQIGASFTGGPQGTLVASGDWKRFLGVPTVSQGQLNSAGQRNVLSQAELANSTQEQQQKAAAFPVDTLSMQQDLQKQVKTGQAAAPEGLTMDKVQQLLNARLSDQQAKAQATKAANGNATTPGNVKAHPFKLKKGGSGRHSSKRRGSSGIRIRKGHASLHHFGGGQGIRSKSTRSKLRQGFGKKGA